MICNDAALGTTAPQDAVGSFSPAASVRSLVEEDERNEGIPL
jgi:hypothetical protein